MPSQLCSPDEVPRGWGLRAGWEQAFRLPQEAYRWQGSLSGRKQSSAARPARSGQEGLLSDLRGWRMLLWAELAQGRWGPGLRVGGAQQDLR